jgi:hypothetical protein
MRVGMGVRGVRILGCGKESGRNGKGYGMTREARCVFGVLATALALLRYPRCDLSSWRAGRRKCCVTCAVLLYIRAYESDSLLQCLNPDILI